MTAALSRRPPRARRRRLIRSLLGAALAVAGVLVPLEAPALPDSPVQAQSNTGESGPGTDNGPPGPGTDDGEPGPVIDDGGSDTGPDGDGPVIQGMPEDCLVGTPRDRNEQVDLDGSLCILEVTACPYDPVRYVQANPGASPRLEPSGDLSARADADNRADADGHAIGAYDGFCEARYLETQDAPGYASCTDPDRTVGFIVVTHIMERVVDEENNPVMDPVLDEHGNQRFWPRYTSGGQPILGSRGAPMEEQRTHSLCRIIHPTNCPVGSQVTQYSCRAVSRRTWSCTDGYVPRNEFNTCYKPLSRPSDPHPACGRGAPELVGVLCTDYAGTDYALSPGDADWACDSRRFSPGNFDTALLSSAANAYWCDFDASLLKVACHSNSQPAGECTTTTASCLKRVSETGGCNAIVNTIRCRQVQAEFAALTGQAQKTQKAKEIREQGCQPCVILPFESVSADCPADLFNEPGAISEYDSNFGDLSRAHESKKSFYWGSGDAACTLSYVSEHGLEGCARVPGACADPPRGNLDWSSSHFSGLAIVNSPVVVNLTGLPTSQERVAGYIWQSSGSWPMTQQSFTYLTFPLESDSPILKWPTPDENISYSGVRQLTLTNNARAECAVDGRPLFRLRVEQLWPDRSEHRDEIERLFGSDALEWWGALSEDDQELLTEARGLSYWPGLGNETLREEEKEERERELIREVDCNYGLNVWCRWMPTHSGYYKLVAAGGWTTKKWTSRTWSRDYDRADLLTELQDPAKQETFRNRLKAENWDPVDVGLNESLTGFLPLPAGSPDEVVYSLASGRCPARDLRVACGGSSSSVNYTTSEPIGIAVHEVRVATRSPLLRTPPPPR